MPFFDTPVGDLQERDLQWLVDNGVPEEDRLDFKLEMYGANDEEKRECLRDATSMANHRGGRIVFGLDEGPGGVAKAVVGKSPVCLRTTTYSGIPGSQPFTHRP